MVVAAEAEGAGVTTASAAVNTAVANIGLHTTEDEDANTGSPYMGEVLGERPAGNTTDVSSSYERHICKQPKGDGSYLSGALS